MLFVSSLSLFFLAVDKSSSLDSSFNSFQLGTTGSSNKHVFLTRDISIDSEEAEEYTEFTSGILGVTKELVPNWLRQLLAWCEAEWNGMVLVPLYMSSLE